jgi:hypothetical protein
MTSTSGPSRAHREAERHRRSAHDPEKNDRQATAISAWRRLLRMPGSGSSSVHGILSSKRAKDEKHSSAGHHTRGKRLGVSGHDPHRFRCNCDLLRSA